MLDQNLIGKTYPEIVFSVEKQRLKFFAKATQQTDPIYFDEDFAKTKGYRSILAPLTFLTTVGYEQENPYQYLEDLGVPLGSILHAKQSCYWYHSRLSRKSRQLFKISLVCSSASLFPLFRNF